MRNFHPNVSDKEIRASAVRVVRYFVNTPADVKLLRQLSIDTLVIRILDTNYDESAFDDRVQALKALFIFINDIAHKLDEKITQNFRK